MQNMGLCVQLTRFSLYDYCANSYTLCYYHNQSEVGPICHCLGLGHETMACVVCLAMFLRYISHLGRGLDGI